LVAGNFLNFGIVHQLYPRNHSTKRAVIDIALKRAGAFHAGEFGENFGLDRFHHALEIGNLIVIAAPAALESRPRSTRGLCPPDMGEP
jgi:hypothetical protein